MFHATMSHLALIALMLVGRPLSAADRLVDGVPLPGDAIVATVAETDPAELRQWAGSLGRCLGRNAETCLAS